MTTNDDILDARDRSPFLDLEQYHPGNLSISQGDIAAMHSGKFGLDLCEGMFVFAVILIEGQVNGHLAQLKSQGRLAWDICMAVALHQVIMHVQGINTVRFEAVVELVQRRGVCQLDRA